MPFAPQARPQTRKTFSDASSVPYWLDDPLKPEPVEALTSETSADLAIIGAGYTGLWAALLAKEIDPARDVILLEAGETGIGASGRNGGFMEPSLTHGFENGASRWPKEIATLTALGYANLNAIEETVQRYHIECDFIRPGEIIVATDPYQVEAMRSVPEKAVPNGERIEWLEREQVAGYIKSPIYLGGLYDPSVIMVNPAQLAWELRRVCLELGVRLHEQSPVLEIEDRQKDIFIRTTSGSVRAKRVALATNAFPPLLRRMSHYIVPVYDYALMTEPLSPAQWSAIGWQGRQGIGDAGNQFHYYRTSVDGRILWGGYDAIYYRNNGVGSQFETNQESFGRLAEHFFETFPQLEGLRFTHAWGGAIDTCSRFSVFWGTAHGGRTAYAAGYTGLGVAASRFGAQVLLDLLDGKDTERTKLEMVRSKPFPFPPEPFRSLVVNYTQRSLDRADRNEGRRNLWLKTLDTLGLGFDS